MSRFVGAAGLAAPLPELAEAGPAMPAQSSAEMTATIPTSRLTRAPYARDRENAAIQFGLLAETTASKTDRLGTPSSRATSAIASLRG